MDEETENQLNQGRHDKQLHWESLENSFLMLLVILTCVNALIAIDDCGNDFLQS
jgi:hypothetical protein